MIPSSSTVFAERLGTIVGCALVAMMMFTTVAPFFVVVPQANIRLIDQMQTILQSVFMVLVGYLWGNSSGNKQLASTVEKQAGTIQEAQAALAPVSGAQADVVVPPGNSIKVKAGEDKA